ncbi:MAG TPA: hypothetical protein PLK85_07200, partial [Alphaproteobacteria bacterium]|nr:hypothetical protein [Alphaproteobacteria bacterium]
DENHTSTAWHLNIALGGTRLMILSEDYDRALGIIKDTIEIEKKYYQNRKAPIIRKPYLKTFIGTIMGFLAGAPSIRPKKKHDKFQPPHPLP